jgi:putative YphP/YqiW family bacilliredoxin
MPYPEEIVAPCREELVRLGAKELRTAADVDAFAKHQKGTALLVVNSVCGCAAGGARPAVALAMKAPSRPDALVTVFAGQDLDATARARSYFGDVPPSSPSMAIWKDGKVVHFVPRHMIEGRPPAVIAHALVEAFEQHAGAAAKA